VPVDELIPRISPKWQKPAFGGADRTGRLRRIPGVPTPSSPGGTVLGRCFAGRGAVGSREVRDALPQRVCPGRGPVARRYRGKLRRRQAPVGKCRRSGARRPRASWSCPSALHGRRHRRRRRRRRRHRRRRHHHRRRRRMPRCGAPRRPPPLCSRHAGALPPFRTRGCRSPPESPALVPRRGANPRATSVPFGGGDLARWPSIVPGDVRLSPSGRRRRRPSRASRQCRLERVGKMIGTLAGAHPSYSTFVRSQTADIRARRQ